MGDGLIDLIEQVFSREKALCLACDGQRTFFVPICTGIIIYGLVEKFVGPLFVFWITFLLDLKLDFADKLWVFQCVPLVAGLFLFYYERAFMGSVSPENQADIIEAFKSTSRYLDGSSGVDKVCFGQVVCRICPTGLQLGRANSSDVGVPFLDLNLSISNGTYSPKINDKRGNFDFGVVDFPFLDGDVSRRASCGVCISRLIRFAGASSNVSDFSCRNKALTAKLLGQGYRYHKLRKAFSEFYRRHGRLVEEYGVSLRKLLRQGMSGRKLSGGLVCGVGGIVGKSSFSEQLRKLINRYKIIGYNPYVMRQTACLVVNPTSVDGYASLFNCTTAGWASDSMTALT